MRLRDGRRMGTYSCTASSILCCATGDVDHLVFFDDLVITLKEYKLQEYVEWGISNMGRCFSSARIASFGLRLYFLRRTSPFVT